MNPTLMRLLGASAPKAERGRIDGAPARTAPPAAALRKSLRFIFTAPDQRNWADSGQDLLDDPAVDVGQAVVAALELERKPLVVDSEALEDGGVEVVYV